MTSPNLALPNSEARLVLIVTDCEPDVSVSCDEDDEELPSFLAQDSIRPSVNAKKAAM
ncbi:MAG: hypothetical protein HN962_03065 [Actinobacteria bacterium]|nr:hypothetical protein [Actinomycetota bacterium]